MSFRFTDFESLLAAVRKYQGNSESNYWADAFFHLLLPREVPAERRFKGGIFLWLIWALRQSASPVTMGKMECLVTSDAAWGFRVLPTPAHLETISPFFRELPQEATFFYSEVPAGRTSERHWRTSFDAVIKATNPSERFYALVHALQLTRRIKQSLTRGVPGAAGKLPTDFTPRLAELILHSTLCLATLQKVTCRHTAIFLSYELLPDSKALVNWAREAGVRVIHVMHGQRLPTYQVTNATDLVLFSKLDELWFRARVAPEVKLWTIGHPRLETMYREIPRKTLSERRPLPRIAFFSQPSEADYDRQTRQNDWKILTALKGRAEVRLRTHPRESRELALLDLDITGLDFVTVSDAGLHEDLEWCDAIASSWSTVSMEAAACGRGIFWTCSTPERYEASQELRDAGIGALLSAATEWEPHLQAWSSIGWTAPVMVSDNKLRELGMIGDMDRSWLERLGLVNED